MPKPYAIAQYLSVKQIDRAVQESYSETCPHPRTVDGFCPLGVAVHDSWRIWRSVIKAPGPSDVAKIITKRPYEFAAIEDAAAVFINDWDDGKITDLASALGVSNG